MDLSQVTYKSRSTGKVTLITDMATKHIENAILKIQSEATEMSLSPWVNDEYGPLAAVYIQRKANDAAAEAARLVVGGRNG